MQPIGQRAGNWQNDSFGGVAPDVDAVTELMAAAGFGEPNGAAGEFIAMHIALYGSASHESMG